MNNTTFWSFLQNQEIEIPIIQRDYAQGRIGKEELRVEFLKDLKKALDESFSHDEKTLQLDFVYGSKENGRLNPLDGQQRLTTLWLLHWYIAYKAEVLETETNIKDASGKLLKNRDIFQRFSYETRISSREFCDELSRFTVKTEKPIVDHIQNQTWFFSAWKQDPTIQAMLNMLGGTKENDGIEKLFLDGNIDTNKDEKSQLLQKKMLCYWEKLTTDTDKCPIKFYFLDLQELTLSDDLYIKMNARGKSLTVFENFKAKFEKYIENIKTNKNFSLKFDTDPQNVSLKDYFSHHIDTKWANLFWQYRDMEENNFDKELMNFIRVIFTYQYAIDNDADENFKILLSNDTNISFYKYGELNALSHDGIFYLIDAFDNLVNNNDKIINHLSEKYKFYFDENAVFENALKNNFSNYGERVMFHAYIRFLIQNKENRTGIEQWMRVIHNLVYNTVIDDTGKICKAIKSIEKMLPESNNILEWLKTNPAIDDFFTKEQVLEEKKKAHLITKNEKWKSGIEYAEQCPYLDGQIGFILNWVEINNEFNFEQFIDYAEKIYELFGDKFKEKKNCLFQRALLTFGDYTEKIGTFCIFKTELRHKNNNWRKVFNDTENKFIKQLLDKISKDLIENDLKQIIKGFPNDINDWKSLFILNEDIIESCNKYRIARWSNNKIALARSVREGWRRHAELYSFTLFKLLKKQEESIKPFNIWYWDTDKRYEPCLCIGGWNYLQKYNIGIDIRFQNNRFSILFLDRNRDKNGNQIPEKVKNILSFFEFDSNNTILLNVDKFDDVINKILEITEKFKTLET